MKLFNATNSVIDLPWGNQRLSIAPKSFSQDFMGTPDFIKLLTTSYNQEELAILVAGPYELSMCANVPVAVNYVVQSMDEAIQRFGLGKEEKKAPEPKPEPEPVKEPEPEPEVKEGEKKEEEEEPADQTPAEPKKKKSTKKTKK